MYVWLVNQCAVVLVSQWLGHCMSSSNVSLQSSWDMIIGNQEAI